MAVVYSTKFVAITGLSGVQAYTVPAGYTAILRDFDVFGVPGAGAVQAQLVGSGGQVIFEAELPNGVRSSVGWRGRQVCDPGDTFSVKTFGGSADVSLSGYLLALP